MKNDKRNTEEYAKKIANETHKDKTTITSENRISEDRAAPLVINPPEQKEEPAVEEVKIVEKEISPEEFMASERTIVDENNVNYTKELKAMVGGNITEVEAYLSVLKSKKVIPDYRVLPTGAVLNTEMREGVVNVFKDITGLVIDIEIV